MVPALPHWLLGDVPTRRVEHEQIVVTGTQLDWLVVDGVVHATGRRGLARGLTWVTDAWSRRGPLVELLEQSQPPRSLLAETELDEQA